MTKQAHFKLLDKFSNAKGICFHVTEIYKFSIYSIYKIFKDMYNEYQ